MRCFINYYYYIRKTKLIIWQSINWTIFAWTSGAVRGCNLHSPHIERCAFCLLFNFSRIKCFSHLQQEKIHTAGTTRWMSGWHINCMVSLIMKNNDCCTSILYGLFEANVCYIIIIIISKWTQIVEWMNRRALGKFREKMCQKVLTQSAKHHRRRAYTIYIWTMQGYIRHNLTNGWWFSWNYKRFIINKVLKSLHGYTNTNFYFRTCDLCHFVACTHLFSLNSI